MVNNKNTSNEYDEFGRLVTANDNKYSTKTLLYGYYDDGTRSAMTDTANTIVVTYTYDKAKRLKTVKRNTATVGTYYYNALGLRTRLTYGNYAWTEYGYNTTTRWLTSVINKRWTAHNIIASSFAYTHDKVGNRRTITLFGGGVITLGYDNTYQLISEVRTVSAAYQLSWGYDKVGNRQWQIKNGVRTDYTCNDANQLVSEITAGITTDSVFDANGNMTEKKVSGVTVAQWGYDWENRQTAYTDLLNPLNNSTYGYDALGRRVSRTVVGVTEKYLLDGANVIADYDGANALKATYVTPFLDDNLLVVSGTVKHYYMHDGLGSVRNLIRSSDQYLSNKYDYYAFGETLSQTEGVMNRYKFTGREWDSESSTYHYRSRSYTPITGRFAGRDKLDYYGGINLYGYVKNNPIRFTDPKGYMTLEACNKVIENSIFGKGPDASTDAWRLYESMMEKCRDGRKECCIGQPTSQGPGSTPNISCGSNTTYPCNKKGVRGESFRDEKGYPQIVLCYDKFNDIPGSTPGSVGTTASQACSQALLHELTHASQDCFGLAVITPPDPIYQVPTKPNEATWPSCGDVVCSEIQAYCSSGEYNSSSKDFYEAVKRSIKSGKTYQACNSDDDNIKAAFDANLDRCCGSKPKGWDWHRPSCKK